MSKIQLLGDFRNLKSKKRLWETLAVREICNELLNCCTKDLRLGINNTHGSKLSENSEGKLLVRIKQLAVHSNHMSIYLKELNRMQEEEGENFAHYVRHLNKNDPDGGCHDCPYLQQWTHDEDHVRPQGAQQL